MTEQRWKSWPKAETTEEVDIFDEILDLYGVEFAEAFYRKHYGLPKDAPVAERVS